MRYTLIVILIGIVASHEWYCIPDHSLGSSATTLTVIKTGSDERCKNYCLGWYPRVTAVVFTYHMVRHEFVEYLRTTIILNDKVMKIFNVLELK